MLLGRRFLAIIVGEFVNVERRQQRRDESFCKAEYHAKHKICQQQHASACVAPARFDRWRRLLCPSPGGAATLYVGRPCLEAEVRHTCAPCLRAGSGCKRPRLAHRQLGWKSSATLRLRSISWRWAWATLRACTHANPTTSEATCSSMSRRRRKTGSTSAALAQEGDRWRVTLAGYFGDYPPVDDEGFRASTQTAYARYPHADHQRHAAQRSCTVQTPRPISTVATQAGGVPQVMLATQFAASPPSMGRA